MQQKKKKTSHGPGRVMLHNSIAFVIERIQMYLSTLHSLLSYPKTSQYSLDEATTFTC